MWTKQDVKITFRNYGEIVVPKGTRLTHKTASGYDSTYHFVEDLEWIKEKYPNVAGIMAHDMEYYGLNIPVECVEKGVDPLDAVRYYRDEVFSIDAEDEYGVHIKLEDSAAQTKWITLNRDSAQVLVEWLQKNYLKND